MQLRKLTVVVWILIAWSCQTETVGTTSSPDDEYFDIIENVVHIVTTCYGDSIDAVGLAGSVPDDLPRRLAQHLIPVVVIDSIRSLTDSVYLNDPRYEHRLQIFIVEVPSPIYLEDIIRKKIRFSVWWNPMGLFFILDRSHGCGKSMEYLNVAWQSNVLNAKVLCNDPNHGREIVTYNPFTSKAPAPWKRVNVFAGNYNHPFTLFSREYRDNETICANLDFEKTNDLGGYPIIIDGPLPSVEDLESFPPSFHEFWSTHERLFSILSRVLNTTVLPINHEIRNDGMRIDIAKGSVLLTSRMLGIWTTYPYYQTGLVIISQFRGHKSQLNKIVSVTDVDSRIGLGIVYLITLIFLKFFVRQALVPAFLNLVRITCDCGFSNLPDNTATRVYMTGFLFFAVTMQGIYQGNLAALLTQQVPLRPINTMQDLVDFDYNIYGPSYAYGAVQHPDLRERFLRADSSNCAMHVVNDSSAGCLHVAQAILDDARKFKLHVSNEFVEMYHGGFQIRWDWPLQQQINVILARIVEADSRETWYVKCNPTKLSDFQIDEEVKKNTDFKILELGELTFAFVILGTGLLCATITFIFEWVIQYKCIFVERQNINWLVPI